MANYDCKCNFCGNGTGNVCKCAEGNASARLSLLSVDHKLLDDVKRLCDVIVNSPPDTMIMGDIESQAFLIAHHPDILNR